jgi:hypothetical protein
MRALLAGLLLGFGLGAGAGGCGDGSGAGGPDWAGEATSQAGRYRIAVRPFDAAAPRGQLHAWVVRIARTDGSPARPSHVGFDGGMPSHGHGFESSPRVTRDLGGGEFLVEGVRFHMAGDWELRVTVTEPEGTDGARLPISVDP